MEGVEDFRRLFPLVIDVLSGNLSDTELKRQTENLSDLLREFYYDREGVCAVGDGTGPS